MQQQLLTSKSDHWNTPVSFLERVEEIDAIGLDPCPNSHSYVNAFVEYSLANEEDGLALPWHSNGLVFVNPPYGRKLKSWTRKIAEEALRGAEIVALTPARTDTRWFHDYIHPYANSMLFWKGRIKFIDGTTGKERHSATFPSLVSYFGPRPTKFKAAFGDAGLLIELR